MADNTNVNATLSPEVQKPTEHQRTLRIPGHLTADAFNMGVITSRYENLMNSLATNPNLDVKRELRSTRRAIEDAAEKYSVMVIESTKTLESLKRQIAKDRNNKARPKAAAKPVLSKPDAKKAEKPAPTTPMPAANAAAPEAQVEAPAPAVAPVESAPSVSDE